MITGILMIVALIPVFQAFVLPLILLGAYEVYTDNTPYSKAFEHFSRGEYGLSIEMFNRVDGLSGDEVPYQELITAYVKNGNFDSALKLSEEYSAEPHKIRGGVYFWSGDYEMAAKEYQAIAKKLEDDNELPDYDLLISLANSYAKLGSDDLALDNYNRAIEVKVRQPDWDKSPSIPNAEALIYRGDFFFWKKEFDKALADYNMVIETRGERDNSSIRGLKHRANLFLKKGDYKSALSDLNKIISYMPYYEFYKVRAYLYNKLEMPEKAKGDLKTYKKLFEKYSDSHSVLWKEVNKIRFAPPLFEVFEEIGDSRE